MLGNHKLSKCVEYWTSFLLQNNCVKCNNILYVVIRFIWKLYPKKLILSMVSPEIDNVRTPPYYIWTIVNTVTGNQSLLKVSYWLDHLKCVCLNGTVLIVCMLFEPLGHLLYIIPWLKAPPLPYLCCICPWFAYISIAQLYTTGSSFTMRSLYNPFTLASVALMLSIIPHRSTLAPQLTEHHFPLV